MDIWTLLLRNAAYYWRNHLGTVLAAAMASAVLAGALLVGDAVRGSLRRMALERLGSVQYALEGGDHFFPGDLGDRLALHPTFARRFAGAEAILLLSGVCVSDASGNLAGQVQVLGVDDPFWTLGRSGLAFPPAAGEVVLNQPLADALGAKVGESVRLRIYRPGLLPFDAPLSLKEKETVLLRAKVSAIIPGTGLGRFDLRANQTVPRNVYVPLRDLQGKLGEGQRANTLLIHGRGQPGPRAQAAVEAALAATWQLTDAQVRVRVEPALDFLEISTSRVFLDDGLADDLLRPKSEAASAALYLPAQDTPGQSALITYFVNAIRNGALAAPYSMVTAGTAPLVDPNLRDDEIELNQWAAEDLQARPGDTVDLEYFVLGPDQKLATRKTSFKVKDIVPLAGLQADPGLMPAFPGMEAAETPRGWSANVPIDLAKIRPKDEAYWKKYKGTPKAFISLRKGVELWRNRFGTFTALRFPAHGDPAAVTAAIAERLRQRVVPAHLGLVLRPVLEEGLAAARQGTDFGTLFLGLSCFLIFAAVLLLALLFLFEVETRASETGLLLALGFRPETIRNLLWGEGLLLAGAGAVLGVYGGLLYARLLLAALATRWRDALAGANLQLEYRPVLLLVGVVSAWLVAAVAIALALRGQARRPARELLAPGGVQAEAAQRPRSWPWLLVGALCLAGALYAGLSPMPGEGLAAAGRFFLVGTLLLITALVAVRQALVGRRPRRGGTTRLPGLGRVGLRAAGRRPGRSLVTAALLACGSFLLLAVGANRPETNFDPQDKSAGTGGFALYGRTAIPVFADLNTPAGRAAAGVADRAVAGAVLYSLRVRAGDEASCLNLNKAQQPRVIGVPASFIARGGFRFVASVEPLPNGRNPWQMLSHSNSDGPIPAVVDYQSLTWALHMKVGDELTVANERGEPQRIRVVGAVANSILQGSVLIAEDEFVKLFPSASGYTLFLIDAPPNQANATRKALAAALRDEGFEAQLPARRLAEFNVIENTYLAAFQALGGLGLLLGSLGLGVVVLRNLLERRGELALLSALGFSRGQLAWMVLSEHAWILGLGLAAGTLSALAAVLPVLTRSGAAFPWAALLTTLLLTFLLGLASALAATWVTLRGPLLAALRND